MDFDFSGSPPQAKTLEEEQSIIDALWSMCRQKQINQLEDRVKTLEEHLSQNSSKPPFIHARATLETLTRHAKSACRPLPLAKSAPGEVVRGVNSYKDF